MDKHAFGGNLRQGRIEKGFTVEALADKCSISSVFVRQIESGIRVPALPNLVRFLNVLHVSPTYLLEEDLNFKEMHELKKAFNKLNELSTDAVDKILPMFETLSAEMVIISQDDDNGTFNKMDFGNRILLSRREMGVSTEVLSKSCNMSRIFISQIELAKQTPSLANFVKICNGLHVLPDQLLVGSLTFDKGSKHEMVRHNLLRFTPTQLKIVLAQI